MAQWWRIHLQCKEPQETWVQSLGWEDLPEKDMAIQSSILAWRIPWTEEPGGLWSMGSQRAEHNWTHTPLVLRVCLGLNFSTLHCNWSQFFEEEIRSCLSCDRLLSQVKSRSHLSRTRGEENSKLCSEWQLALFADHSVGGWKKGTIWSPLDLPLLAWDHNLTSPGRQQGPGLPWWLRW